MSVLKEFRTFLQRGNVMDLAVAVVIAGAFGKIISSFVADVLMPPVGLLLGGVTFTDLKWTIGGTAEKPVTLNYGNFVQALVDFLIIALAIFSIVKAINAMQRKGKDGEVPPAPSSEEILLTEIRDLLKERQK